MACGKKTDKSYSLKHREFLIQPIRILASSPTAAGAACKGGQRCDPSFSAPRRSLRAPVSPPVRRCSAPIRRLLRHRLPPPRRRIPLAPSPGTTCRSSLTGSVGPDVRCHDHDAEPPGSLERRATTSASRRLPAGSKRGAAVDLVGGPLRSRIKACAQPGCWMLFLDASRSSRRRWGSMDRCGSRTKGETFRHRHKEDRHEL